MRDYKKLKKPTIIVTTGKRKVLATATGTIWGYIIDQTEQRVPGRISAIIEPGLGTNLLSSVTAMDSGVRSILETGNLHLHFNSKISFPPNPQP